MYTEIILSCSWKIHYLSDEILLRSLLSHNVLLLGQDNWWLSALRRIISVSNKFIAADIYQKSKLVDHKSQIIKANFLMRKNNPLSVFVFLSFQQNQFTKYSFMIVEIFMYRDSENDIKEKKVIILCIAIWNLLGIC